MIHFHLGYFSKSTDCGQAMTQLEIQNQLHEEIDQLGAEALMQLRAIISTLKKPSTTFDKRIDGQYKGQFVIKEDFDQLPDDFVAAFTED